MKRIRLTSGLGFYGDNWHPVLAAIERGDVDYVCSDHLAELTLAILQKDRLKDPNTGYTRDLVPMLTRLWPTASSRGVKFVLNAGGLNPRSAAEALQKLFAEKGWRARIAVVTGDNVLPLIDQIQLGGNDLQHMDTGAPIESVRDQIIFANAYLGAQPIAQALAQDADIVITGRVADAALFLGPLIFEFEWDAADWHRLAQGVTAGHLLECSGQGAGGNFGAAGVWQRIPDLAHIGFPIADVGHDGDVIICKAPDSGGRINFHTVRQQLLYEVHNPRAYVTPDVILDMSELELKDLGNDRVSVSGAIGTAAPNQLKIVAGYANGWMGHIVTGFCWPDVLRKANAAVNTIRLMMQEAELQYDELCVEFIGHNAFLGPHATPAEEDAINEIWLRMAIRTRHKKQADAFPRLFPWLALSGPPFMGGFHGIPPASQLIGLWPTLVPRRLVETQVSVDILK
ncbi:MAG: acyclic terpene utilization AtuA family protein [Burkholderiaceae bacterium]